MPQRARFAVLGLGLLALLAPPAGAGEDAGKPPAADPRDAAQRLAAAVLEANNLRMRALIDQSGILDGAGRHDEALAALRQVEKVHAEGVAWLKEVLASTRAAQGPVVVRIGPGAPTVPFPVPFPTPPSRPPTPVDRPIARSRPAMEHDPVPRAIEYLIGAQGPDGLYGGSFVDTAWAVLALLDALDAVDAADAADAAEAADAGEDRARIAPRVRKVLDRALDALVADQDTSGWLGKEGDVEGHVMATWAVTAAVAHLGGDDRRRAQEWALQRVVDLIEAGDGRLDGTRPLDEQMVLAAWTAATLHEAEALGVASVADLRRALETLARWVDGFHRAGNRATGVASALVLRAAGWNVPSGTVSPLHLRAHTFVPAGHEDAEELLLGTIYFAYGSDRDEWQAWSDVLAQAAGRQRRSGPEAGSWGGGATRVRSTARTLLAWLAPQAAFREPARPK